jgi:hypothetical protein
MSGEYLHTGSGNMYKIFVGAIIRAAFIGRITVIRPTTEQRQQQWASMQREADAWAEAEIERQDERATESDECGGTVLGFVAAHGNSLEAL